MSQEDVLLLPEGEIENEQNLPLIESIQRKRKLQTGILAAFTAVVFLLGGLIYLVSSPDPETTVLLISLDGFRYEYLERGLTPYLQSMMKNGVHSKLQPSFPSSTFPNHMTLLTGLHPQDHGIVDNKFYDLEFNETFDFQVPSIANDPKWYTGETIWQTVENANKSTYAYMFPGCTVNATTKPSKCIPYNTNVTWSTKIDDILHELNNDRPKFMALYTPEIDQYGHSNGVYSTQVNKMLETIDNGFGKLIDGIRESGLQDFVNIVVVSDHGMMNLLPDAFIDYTKWTANLTERVKITDEGIVWGAFPIKDEVTDLYLTLKNVSMYEKTFNVYLREEVPEHLSYSDSSRIPPIIALPNPGYYIAKSPWIIRGLHGYDPAAVDEMSAIFIGYGPSFEGCPNNPFALEMTKFTAKGKKCVWDKFENTVIHSLLCKLLFEDPEKCRNINSVYQ